ncbi:MAG: S-layer homology domain-containing protein [Clostridia bacterium]|nr:S-layer homology domain-containing protein [Clostridia bacterium]
MKKRILSCILMISCLMTSAYAYFDDVTDSDCEEQINLLTALNIFSGYDDGLFHPEDTLTRAELVTIITRMMNVGNIDINSYTYYKDVDASYWALSAINVATAQGIINGYEDGTFRPDGNVTVAEMVKAILCALGYGGIAETSGGYPTGYMSLAAKNKLTVGVSGGINDAATRADAAKIIYAALTVKLAETTGEEKYEIGDRTVLDSILGVHKREGTVTATKLASTVPSDELDDDEIVIDSVKYKINDEFLQELVGYKLTFYVRERSDGDTEIVYYEIDTPESAAVWVAAEDVLSGDSGFSLTNFVYYENDKRKTLRLGADYVSYNGESVPASLDLFDIKDGNILLIDSDSDGAYETVFINSGITIVADRINKKDKIISDKIISNRKIDLMPEENAREVSITKDGRSIEFSEIKTGDVITYTESHDKKRATASVSEKKADGVVTSTSNGSDKLYVYIGKDKYIIRGSAYDILNDNGILAAIMPGTQINIYLDVYGNAVYADLKGKTNEKYGALIAAYKKEEGLDVSVTLRIYPESGDVTDFKLADKVTVRKGYEKERLEPSQVFDKLADSALNKDDDEFKHPMFQLIKFKTDEEGNINSISIADKSADGKPIRDSGRFALDFTADKFRTNQKDVINAAYLIDSATKIFVIPEERSEYDDYSRKISLTKSMTMKVGLYDMNDVNHVGAALIIYPKVDDGSSGNYYDNSIYTPFLTVRKTRECLNDKGDVVHQWIGVGNNGEMTVDLKKEDEFNVGDIYQFVRVNGKVVKKNLIFNGKTKEFKFTTPNNYGYGLSTGSQTVESADWWNRLMTEAAIGYLKVVKISGTKVILTDGEREYMFTVLPNQTRFAMYDSSMDSLKNKVKVSEFDELEVGDNVVVRTHTLNIGDIVIIR